MPLKLNLGCGPCIVEGFVNIDILLGGTHPVTNEEWKPDIQHDLCDGIPYADNSVDAIVANHLLEHLKFPLDLIDEMYRVCRPKASVEITVPLFEIGFRADGDRFRLSYPSMEGDYFEVGETPNVLPQVQLYPLSLAGHKVAFHPHWFEVYLDRDKWKIVKKHIFAQQVPRGWSWTDNHPCIAFLLQIFLESVKEVGYEIPPR